MRRDWDRFVTSTPEARAELVWLLTYFRSENQRGFPIFWVTKVRHMADYQLSVNASYRGGGWQTDTVTAPAPVGRGRRLLMELGCGTGSAGLAFLLDNEDNPDAVVVFVDVYPPAVAFKVFNTYGLSRFREQNILLASRYWRVAGCHGYRPDCLGCVGCNPLRYRQDPLLAELQDAYARLPLK